jgi:chromosome partitioning protein
MRGKREQWIEGGVPNSATAEYWRISNLLRQAQRVAIEVENAPDKRKRLRQFTPNEVASLLDVDRKRALAALGLADNLRFMPRPMVTFDDIVAARSGLYAETADLRFAPRRHPERGEALAIVAFANFKGGSGKTTSAVHFAQHLALGGYRVLLVDLDSQGSATSLFGVDPGQEVSDVNSFSGWVCDDRVDATHLARKTYWPTIDLLAGGPVLQQAEFRLAERAGRSESSETPHWLELARYLAAVQDSYDVAVVDTRPDVNMLMVNALHTATGLIIPTQATMVDLASTGEFFGFLGGYIDQMKPLVGTAAPDFYFAKVLVTRFIPSERSQMALLELLRARFGRAVLADPMLHSAVMGTAGVAKETLYEYEALNDRKAYDRALASMQMVNRLIEAEMLRFWGRGVPWETVSEGIGA